MILVLAETSKTKVIFGIESHRIEIDQDLLARGRNLCKESSVIVRLTLH